jgi:hypothetical protein
MLCPTVGACRVAVLKRPQLLECLRCAGLFCQLLAAPLPAMVIAAGAQVIARLSG